jgi:hypothetical protein
VQIAHRFAAVAGAGGPARIDVHDGGSLAGKLCIDASETRSNSSSAAAARGSAARLTAGGATTSIAGSDSFMGRLARDNYAIPVGD